MQWHEMAVRSVASLIVLFILTKLMGKKQISQLSLFDYVVGITIGSIAAEMAFNTDVEVMHAITAMVIYALAAMFASWITCKSNLARRLITGVPQVLIERGQPIYSNLMRARFDINDLLCELRSQGYFNIADVEFAVMETSGHVSVLPKSGVRPLTPDDMNMQVTQQGLSYNVIIDGEVLEKNLTECGFDRNWLSDRLKEQGFHTHEEVFLATCDEQGTLSAYRRVMEPSKNCPFE